MRKIAIEDLKKIKEKVFAEETLSPDTNRVRVTVHMGTCGIACGADKVYARLLEEIQASRTRDIRISKSGCMGFCAREPLVTVEVFNQESILYQYVNEEKISHIFKKHILGGKIQAPYALARGREQQMREDLPKALYGKRPSPGLRHGIPVIGDIQFFAGQEPRVLRNRGLIDPEKIDDYIARDGYQGMAMALTEMTPEKIVDEVIRSGIRGRGGAGFPTGLKWKFAASSKNDVKYILCNADEGDPGAYMDRSVLEGDPHSILEGMVIAAKAIGAYQGYIYCRAEYPLAIKTLTTAIKQAREYGLLGKDILGTGFDFDLGIYKGAGAFVCGEETALMTSIEGKRGEPRPRPPFPAIAGLWRKPSVLNNVETLAGIGRIIFKGADWFAGVGTPRSRGTKIFALTGDVLNVGLLEVPMGTPLGTIVFDIGGGIPDGKKFKAAQLGGPSGGCIPVQHLNALVDYETVAQLGAIMGSGGMIVMNEDKCAVDMARFFMDFCQDESCGKCIPCREGTKRMLEILNNICSGKGTEGDIDLLKEMAGNIKKSALCGLGQTAPNPVLSTLMYFQDEYEAHIRDKRCPAVVCSALFKSPCQHACPAGMDVPSYIALVRGERYEDAYKVLFRSNPFPASCARVCDHKCQLKCRRGMADGALTIRDLKRFITDHAQRPKVEAGTFTRKEKIAVIGGGPAGLTAAKDLVMRGYPTTVFEARPEAGGWMRWGIPAYRLPRDILGAEIDHIRKLGVEIHTHTAIGKDISLKEIEDQFDYIFIAVGAQKSQKMEIPGEDLKGVYGGVEFLVDFNTHEKDWLSGKKSLGRDVVVVGGGNSAIDAARTAARLGAEVTILYRREKKDMPAELAEVVAAEEEGVKIVCLTTPVRISGKNGRVSEIMVQTMKPGDFDSSGRRKALAIKDSEQTIKSDMVIMAISQVMDASFIPEETGLTIKKDSFFRLAEVGKTRTPNSRYFVGGDAVTGPATVIEAIAAGHQAACDIDDAIRSQNGEPPYVAPADESIAIPFIVDQDIDDRPPAKMPSLAPEERIKSFTEMELGYSRKAAHMESERCLRCDTGC